MLFYYSKTCYNMVFGLHGFLIASKITSIHSTVHLLYSIKPLQHGFVCKYTLHKITLTLDNITRFWTILGQCRESGEDASANADRNPEKLGSNMDRRPQAGGPYWTPISKNEDGILRYIRARIMVFTLLSIQSEPYNKILVSSRFKLPR